MPDVGRKPGGSIRMMEAVRREVGQAARSLVRVPVFTLVAVLTLAVGIGASSAISAMVDAVLLRPLPYPNAHRIVRVALTVRPSAGLGGQAPFSDRGYQYFSADSSAFVAFGGYSGHPTLIPLTGDGPPVQVLAGRLTRGAFDVLGVEPALGRLPTSEEDAPGGPRVVLLSHGLWVDRYGGSTGALGQVINLNGTSVEIVGVMPIGFDFPDPDIDVWLPYQLDPTSGNYSRHHIEVLARLRSGVTMKWAEAYVGGRVSGLKGVGYSSDWFSGVFDGHARVWSLREDLVGDVRKPLWIVFASVVVVLLIACGNVANLLVVRAEGRVRDSAVRMALGASRASLAVRAYAESMMLAALGGALGALLSWVGVRALVAAVPKGLLRIDAVDMRLSVIASTVGATFLIGLVLGLLPAHRLTASRNLGALRDGCRGGTIGPGRHRVRRGLVVGQVAMALVLLMGSGLMVRTVWRLRAVDPGFIPGQVMTFGVRPVSAKYDGPEAVASLYDELRTQLRELPRVTNAGGTTTLPLTGGGSSLGAVIDEFPPAQGEFPPTFQVRRVTPGYFETLGIPIVEGRDFTSEDHRQRLGSLVISKAVKERYWPSSSALGKRITVAGTPARVVGVVGDIHDAGLHRPVERSLYLPMLDSVGGGVSVMSVVVRTVGAPLGQVSAVRQVLASVDPDLPMGDLRTLEAVVDASMSRTTFTMTLLLIGATISLFLCCVGIYGVMSYIVSQRTVEIGIRMALGASHQKVRREVLGEGLVLVGLGELLGLLVVVGAGRILMSLLYGVGPLDGPTLAGSMATFLVVGFVATLVPAVRASSLQPFEALRSD
ncbi:MAG: ABC transporter permease [Longimicrobiales bacterium]